MFIYAAKAMELLTTAIQFHNSVELSLPEGGCLGAVGTLRSPGGLIGSRTLVGRQLTVPAQSAQTSRAARPASQAGSHHARDPRQENASLPGTWILEKVSPLQQPPHQQARALLLMDQGWPCAETCTCMSLKGSPMNL